MLRGIFNPYIQLFFMMLSLGLMVLYLFKYKYSMVDLEGIYNDFYDLPQLDSRMTFNIDIDGCNITGVYEGDSFREVSASGQNIVKCKRYNYKVGNDPNEFVNKLVGSDFASKMHRLHPDVAGDKST